MLLFIRRDKQYYSNTLADLGEEVTIDKVYEFIAGVFGSSKAD